MHWLDILILVILGAGCAMGYCSGLLWQVARVVSLALSLYVAILANAGVTEWLSQHWSDINPAVNRVFAFGAVFLLVYLILYQFTRMVHSAIKASKLETVDRLLGSVLGAAKMAALIACICAVLVALDLQVSKAWFKEATLAPQFAKGTEIVIDWIPPEYRERANENVQDVRDQLQQKLTDAALDAMKPEQRKK